MTVRSTWRLGSLGLLLACAVAQAQPVPLEDDETALEARAKALNAKVFQLHFEGRLVQALPLAEEALALRRRLYSNARYPDGHPALAESLNNLAALLDAGGDLARAEPLYRQALAIFQKLYPAERFPLGHRELANSLNNLGFILQARGDLVRAEPFFRQALAMNRQLYPEERYPDGHHDLARSLSNLGLLLQTRGDLAQAEPFHRQAWAMLQQLYPRARFPSGHPELASMLNNMGGLLSVRGELARAEPLYRQALEMRRQLYPTGRFPDGHHELAGSVNNLGHLLLARGELAQAEVLYREALAMRHKLYPRERFPQGHPELAGSLNNLATLLDTRGEMSQAEPLHRQALAMNQRLYPTDRYPDGHPALAASLNNLGALLQDRGELVGAEHFSRRALEMRRQLYPRSRFANGHPELANCLNNLGALLHARGELAQAEPLYREALTMRQRLYPPESFPSGHRDLATSLTNLANLLQARGELTEVEPLFRKGLAMHQGLTEVLLAGSSEAQAFNHLANLPVVRDGYLFVTRSQSDGAGAYAAVWQSKGTLARWLTQRRLALARTGDIRADELIVVRRDLAALLMAPDAAARGRRLGELSRRKEDLEKELALRLPAFAHALETARRTPDDLRQALPPNAVFIDLLRYLLFDLDPQAPGQKRGRPTASYVAFVVASDRVRRVELGEAKAIDAAVAAWRRQLDGSGGRGPEPEGPETPAQAVRRLVWLPLAKDIPAGTHTVWLAPDDRLTGVPWAALPGPRPGMVLLEEYALAVVPHGGVLLEGLAQAPRSRLAAAGVLALGGVDYTPAQGTPKAELAWPALPATAKERQRVLALAADTAVKGQALAGQNASAAALLKALPSARWAHLATHGFFADPKLRSVLHLDEQDYEKSWRGERVGVEARNPLSLSGLVLSGSEVLTAEAIAGTNLDGLELVVLSACETGLGEVAGGEGVLGLQRAFHIAGARNVVASLWKVDDEATAALMSLFYANLWQEKMAPLEALRQAQLTLYRHPGRIAALARQRGPDFTRTVRLPPEAAGEGRAPARLWAGFVLSGAGR